MNKVPYTTFRLSGWSSVNQGQAGDLAGKLANRFTDTQGGSLSCDSVFTFETGVSFTVSDARGGDPVWVKKGWRFRNGVNLLHFEGGSLADVVRLAYLMLLHNRFPAFAVEVVETANSTELFESAIELARAVDPEFNMARVQSVFSSVGVFFVPDELDFRA